MAADLACDKFWVNKYMYHDAEKTFYSSFAKEGVGITNVSGNLYIKPSLAGEVAKTRELIKNSMEHVDGIRSLNLISKNTTNVQNSNNREISCLAAAIKKLEKSFKSLEERVGSLENKCIGLPADIVKLEKAIWHIKMDGLTWETSQLMPITFVNILKISYLMENDQSYYESTKENLGTKWRICTRKTLKLIFTTA